MNDQLLSSSQVGKHYLAFIAAGVKMPSLDDFLDYRNWVAKSLEEGSLYTYDYWTLELVATDEILKRISEKNGNDTRTTT